MNLAERTKITFKLEQRRLIVHLAIFIPIIKQTREEHPTQTVTEEISE